MKKWTRPGGKYPKYYHETLRCFMLLKGEVFESYDTPPTGVELCPDCERRLAPQRTA